MESQLNLFSPRITSASKLRRRVLQIILSRGDYGATDHEIREQIDSELFDSIRPRRCELLDAGLLINTGRKRPSPSRKPCTVWVARRGVKFEDLLPHLEKGAKERKKRKPKSVSATGHQQNGESTEKAAKQNGASALTVATCSCGSTRFIESECHSGETIRRDCSNCGKVSHPKWRGKWREEIT